MTGLLAERVVVRILAAPLAEPIPMSFSRLTERRMCLVEVHAGGEVGYGESWINYPEWAATERMATLLEGVAPVLLGTDVSDPADVLDRLVARLSGVGRQWGARGPIWQAISAVDLALWDLRGRLAGLPVGELLGQVRPSAPVYASGVGPTDVPQLCALAVERGIRAVKAKVGFGDETDRATIAAIRKHAPGARVFADANCAWAPAEAAQQTLILADEGIEWLEEPLLDPGRDALEQLHLSTGMPLAAGENCYGLNELTALAHVPGVDQVQPDPAKSGGITVATRLAAALVGTRSRLSPHWYAGAIGLRASLALATSQRSAEWVELDVRSNPLRDTLVGDGFRLDESGQILAARAPGLVGDLDHDRVAALQIATADRSAP
ncbi:mandelate racemase/muconate lactonizing enzyme family protein [Ruania zhangjianzhongii]|nr:mandelate racemase/muconate lactonizing enzyme family protein [Ruania zhangjianzhongii]